MSNVIVPIALIGWIPVCVVLFALFPARKALLVSLLGGYMFLPMAGMHLAFIEHYDKSVAVTAGALLGFLLFDIKMLWAFRLSWWDMPILAWIVVNGVSAYLNIDSAYGAFSMMSRQMVIWGIPYLLGRCYFRNADELQLLAKALFVGGLVYLPLCLLEIRLSPQLHYWVYGYYQHQFAQTLRWGGYRPTVFMQHGLAVATWMTCASVCGFWLWWVGALKRIWGLPAGACVVALIITTILCRSTGAWFLLAAAVIALAALRWWRTKVFILVLAAFPFVYPALRVSRWWNGQEMVDITSQVIGRGERADSLAGRLTNEQLLVDHALEQPWFGWSGWDRATTSYAWGGRVTQDSYWIIALGMNGVVGLAAYTLMQLHPTSHYLLRHNAVARRSPQAAPLMCICMVTIMVAIDNLFNGMPSPVWVACIGALTTVGLKEPTGSTYLPQSGRRKVDTQTCAGA